MILSLILELLFQLLDLIFSLLPDIAIDGLDTIFSAIRFIFDISMYFIPVDAFRIVFGYVMLKFSFKLIVRLLRFAKGVLPFI